ncbi:MAG: hypothetical protein WB439_13940 [Acidobacteriaceae bacterium]
MSVLLSSQFLERMAEYFPGRRLVRNRFAAVVFPGKLRVDCTIYERWEFRIEGSCSCDHEAPVEYEKTRGVSKTSSVTVEKTLEALVGAPGLMQIKGALRESLGVEVNWSGSETERFSDVCKAPKCGRATLVIYQLVREYELLIWRRGQYPYGPNVWKQNAELVSENVSSYTAVPETTRWDKRCGCDEVASPEFDGRLSIDMGELCLLVPYKIQPEVLQVQIANIGVSFPFMQAEGAQQLEMGLRLPMERRFLSPALQFFANLSSESLEVEAHIFREQPPADRELVPLIRFSKALAEDMMKKPELIAGGGEKGGGAESGS